MIIPTLQHRILSIALVFAASISFVRAQYLTSQSAGYVWGQSNFNTGTTPSTPAVNTLSAPWDICVDPTTSKFFVADSVNNRVLRYASTAAYLNGAAAEAVFGQPDYVTKATGNANTGMNTPQGIVVDSSGNLWVADTNNSRVLKFSDASSLSQVSGAIEADIVLGQSDFGTSGAAVSQSQMNKPVSVAVDSQGTLYVADSGNNRVLEFTNAKSAVNFTAANRLIGQINFNANGAGTTATTLSRPGGVAVDSSNNLWVSDILNSRVLFYPASTVQGTSQGAAATLAIGQANLTSGGASTTSTTLQFPTHICFDNLGRLYVADSDNNRVLVYENPTKGTGTAANFVLGQPNFTTSTAGTTATSFSQPRGVIFSQNLIFVTDSNNNRVLNFSIVPGRPAFTVPSLVQVNPKGTRNVTVKLTNSGGDDKFKVKVTIPDDANKLAKFTFTDSTGTDITSKVSSGNYTTSLFGPNGGGSSVSIKVKIAPKPAASKPSFSGARFSLTFQATSITSASIKTQKNLRAKFKKIKQ